MYITQKPIENWNIFPSWKIVPHEMNFQILIVKGFWFEGNEENTLNAINNDKDYFSKSRNLLV